MKLGGSSNCTSTQSPARGLWRRGVPSRPSRGRLRSMVLVPSMLFQVFCRKSAWLRWLLKKRKLQTSKFWRRARQIGNSSSARVLGTSMHSFREFLDLLLHELCCGSLGSDLLLLELKLLLDLNVEGWLLSSATLAP